MKIKGYKPKDPNMEIVVIPRGNSDPIVFKLQAVLDTEPFDKLCPAPVPPTITKPGGEKIVDITNPTFRKKLREHVEKKTNWLLIQSLLATEDLEFEKVKLEDSETWQYVLDELKDFNLTTAEINRVIIGYQDANGLNESKLEAAREDFLASQAEEQSPSSSQNTESKTTQSGDPVSE